MFEIDSNFITETNADIKKYAKGSLILSEDSVSKWFLFLLSGELYVYNHTPEGKEFLQHKVQENQFFGEPAVLLEKPFPGNVVVISESAEILRINRENLLKYLLDHPEWCLEFAKSIAEKNILKSNSLKNLIFLNPEDRILKQLNEYKGEKKEEIMINLTRKELSYMTGLRIETIIRTIKKMEKDGKLKIVNGKVFY